MIHAFDDPIHAPIALEAAHKYANIAPAGIARPPTCPTHIFIQHGMWETSRRVERFRVSGCEGTMESPVIIPIRRIMPLTGASTASLQKGDVERSKEMDRKSGTDIEG